MCNVSAPLADRIVISDYPSCYMYRLEQIERGQAIGKMADQTDKKDKEQKRRI